MRAASAEEALAAETTRLPQTQDELRQLQDALAEAEGHMSAADASRRTAEEETRRALPIWQEQLHHAESQLRQLAHQHRDKDGVIAAREQENSREHENTLRGADRH